jgi:hypothetical protein
MISASSAGGYVTLTAAQALGSFVLIATGALSADHSLIVPNNQKPYVLANQTTGGHSVIIKTAAGTGISVAPDGSYRLVFCDGVNVVKVT